MKRKICTICKIKKSISEFNNYKRGKNGKESRCKKCSSKATRKWFKSNKGQTYYQLPQSIYRYLKCRAKQRNLSFKISCEDFINWYDNELKICIYCKRTAQEAIKDYNGYHTRLSIDRKDNNAGYQLDNMVLCCYNCNVIKGNRYSYKEMQQIAKVIIKIAKERIR